MCILIFLYIFLNLLFDENRGAQKVGVASEDNQIDDDITQYANFGYADNEENSHLDAGTTNISYSISPTFINVTTNEQRSANEND